ncbi:MAG: DUF4230 domain-containing protein [Clostridiaceae bacterium]
MKTLIKASFYTLSIILACILIFKYSNATIQKINPVKSSTESKRYISEESILENILSQQKVIVTEVTLKEKITVDNSYGSLAIFKKVQSIYFIGKAAYTVDLSRIEKSDITLDNDNNTLSVVLPSPTVLDDNIYIDEKQTSYEEVKKGLLRFGEIKFTSSEYSNLLTYIKEKMKEKLQEEEYTEKAKENTSSFINNLFSNIYKDNPDLKITISYK